MPVSQNNDQRRTAVAKAWLSWLLLFVPLFAAVLVGMNWLGLSLIFPILIGLLLAVLLYQRLIRRRSWRSIMWGVHASK
jgi:ABC-type sugar transport system permease subunit